MATILTGLAFGASLVASGVYQPSVILGQLNLTNWHMIQAFLTATATSGILVTIAQSTGYATFKPRSYSPLGLFSRLDGNILGGILLGHGLALAGACPGTVLSQVALGIKSGYYALAGAAAGGVVYTGFVKPFFAARKKDVVKGEKLGVHEVLGVSRTAGWLGLEAVLVGVVAASAILTSLGPEAKIHPVLGGLLIGGVTQGISILTRKSLVGISTGFEEVGEWFWAVVRGETAGSYSSIVFSAAIMAGSWAMAYTVPSLGQVVGVEVAPVNAALGGALMVIGSRVAGGCTSGHGVSGMSLLSVSSAVTIGVAVAWGAVAVKFLI
ncbi:hypothetical protein GE09DRAFT_1291443 [Coniochaeta sp. 2T2.1]|nr:hypothetical protein GE09DRAFT_1291443 [Coniochaeta sp. 2T2.1]